MKKIFSFLVFILCIMTVYCYSVTFVKIDNQTNIEYDKIPDTCIFSCDVSSPGSRVNLEFYLDTNNNSFLDRDDYLFDFMSLTDGINWIRDTEAPDNDIPGDESATECLIETTHFITAKNAPVSRQKWIVRVVDADKSSATAVINWNIRINPPYISGYVLDNKSNIKKPGSFIFARETDYSDITFAAVTDSTGYYRIQLPPGYWRLYSDKPSDTLDVQITKNSKLNRDLRLNPFESFIKGVVTLNDGTPVPDFVVTAQNTEKFLFYHTTTDSNGNFNLGVNAGKIVITASPYFSNLLGNQPWPDGYYSSPASINIDIDKGQTITKDISLKKYPFVLTGKCETNEKALQGVLVQGISFDRTSQETKLCQAYSKQDGRFTLGVFSDSLISVIAQKKGYSSKPVPGFEHFYVSGKSGFSDYNFDFIKDTALMSVSGCIYIDNNRPAQNVPVIAYNRWEKSAKGYLLDTTNDRGEFSFNIEVEGSWQIGIYKKDYQSIPPMFYLYVNEGMNYNGIKFYLRNDTDPYVFEENQVRPAAFKIINDEPNPIDPLTKIQFVLPEKRQTRVELLDMAGNRLNILMDEILSGGKHVVTWDGKDKSGEELTKGFYLCRIQSKNETILQPITLLR
ncbi:carboxypeptidase regulatory-like domain-containing protein [candidate division KSB1 bacterium]|nr:carboxypeptidase regulatory-like domain-containing protein [candidate division KSB1 bacterium]